MKKTTKRLIRTITPPAIIKRLRSHFRQELRKERKRKEDQVPKVSLSKEHMENCELLLDRSELLSAMSENGRVVEIGVDNGDFSSRILNIAKPKSLHLIDVWGSERYHQGLFESVKSRFVTEIESGKVEIHRKLSTEAVHLFPESYFDWIYLDTNHTYETTREELLRYAPKLKINGIIAGHDYSMGNWTKGFRYGVIEAVHEFCVEHDWELIYLTLEPIENQSFAIRRILKNEA